MGNKKKYVWYRRDRGSGEPVVVKGVFNCDEIKLQGSILVLYDRNTPIAFINLAEGELLQAE